MSARKSLSGVSVVLVAQLQTKLEGNLQNQVNFYAVQSLKISLL